MKPYGDSQPGARKGGREKERRGGGGREGEREKQEETEGQEEKHWRVSTSLAVGKQTMLAETWKMMAASLSASRCAACRALWSGGR